MITRSSLENVPRERPSIETTILEAAKVIAPVWPLNTAVACNPLLHLEDQNFWEALESAERLFETCEQERERNAFVNRQMIKWAQGYFDNGIAVIHMPARGRGFYKAWKALAIHDSELVKTQEDVRLFSSLPESSLPAIEYVLETLKVPDEEIETFLAAQFVLLPGWGGYVRWLSEWNGSSPAVPSPLTEFLAVRLGIYLIARQNKNLDLAIRTGSAAHKRLEKDAVLELENAVANRFIPQFVKAAEQEESKRGQTAAQWVFCIDVRSEPFRRQLEKSGNYETFGFAGFFGLPIALSHNGSEPTACCPVLLKPKWVVEKNDLKPTSFRKTLKSVKQVAAHSYSELKYRFATPFSLAEAMGAFSGLWMFVKSFTPTLSDKLKALFHLPSAVGPDALHRLSLEDQVEIAFSALQTMGLVQFAPLVIFCGHASKSQNNPFATSLDCGACGGNHGGTNAHLLACVLNAKEVREALSKRGIAIPEETCFIGAEHNTTTDEVVFYDEAHPSKHLLKELKKDAQHAAQANRHNRNRFFGVNNGGDILRRSLDWSEVRPEWGLAGNAGFLVGPRTLSVSLDLEGKFFLHSYDWRLDSEGLYLETILTAPMVVAEWINTFYLFSTLTPQLYGSGSKTTHNVVGKIGVMQGNGSDLMHGLPLQSVFVSDEKNFHEPARLLTVVFAPLDRIDRIVARQPILQKLFYNEWVNLIAIDPLKGCAYRLKSSGQWTLFE